MFYVCFTQEKYTHSTLIEHYEDSFDENSYSPELLNRGRTPDKRPRQDRAISYSQAVRLVRNVKDSLTNELKAAQEQHALEMEEMRALIK